MAGSEEDVRHEAETWQGCYDDGWRGLIVDEAFAHPAKFARGLIVRIFDDLDLPFGSVVVDPFGGIGLGGIEAASNGLRWFGCELEERFVDLANRNFTKLRKIWIDGGDPLPVIVQGDSRKLRANLAGVMADCVVSSPPYAESLHLNEPPEVQRKRLEANGNHSAIAKASRGGEFRSDSNAGYGNTEGNLGSMPPGSVDAVVSSPPYSECLKGDGTAKETAAESRALRRTEGGSLGQSQRHAGYGGPENLGNLPAGNVADCIVGSPPFEGSLSGKGECPDSRLDGSAFGHGKSINLADYGATNGQLGNSTGETFWSAAREIVAECHAILKSSGVAVFVCKDFIRKGERVPFSADWVKLCEACGFKLTKWVRASLVKEDRHPGMFGEDVVKTTERKSFFRRLAEKKGSPRIDHEDVLFFLK